MPQVNIWYDYGWEDSGQHVQQQTPRLGSSRTSSTNENIEFVETSFHDNPRQSVRKRAAFLELSKTIAHDILKKDREFHPFNIQTVQAHKPMLERLEMWTK